MSGLEMESGSGTTGRMRAAKAIETPGRSLDPAWLISWSGLALALGGILIALYLFLHPGDTEPGSVAVINSSPYTLVKSPIVAGLIILQLGLIGYYARLMGGSRYLALVAFLLTFLSAGLAVGGLFTDAFINPILAANQPALLNRGGVVLADVPLTLASAIPHLTLALGFVLLGIATLRQRRLPRLAGGALVIAGLLLVIPPFGSTAWRLYDLAGLLLVLSLGWIGLAIWRRTGTAPPEGPVATG